MRTNKYASFPKKSIHPVIILTIAILFSSFKYVHAQPSSSSEKKTIKPRVIEKSNKVIKIDDAELAQPGAVLERRFQRLPVKGNPGALKERHEFYVRPIKKNEAENLTTFNHILGQAGLNSSKLQDLREAGVKSLATLRSNAGLEALSNLQETELKKVVTASRLSLLSSDLNVVSALLRHRISLRDLEKWSNSEIIEKSEGAIGDDAAESLKKRALILSDIIKLRERTLRVLERNPLPIYTPTGITGPQLTSARQEARAIEACGSHNNVFSPSTYLIHLLDFITKWLNMTLSDLDLVILMQQIEDLPADLSAGDEVRNVSLTNRILENVIARWWDSDPKTLQSLPNTNISWGWKDLHLPLNNAVNNQTRIDIYDEFKSETYHDEPEFDPNVMVRLFDSYVREFGTTRREIHFVSRSMNIKDRFKERRELTDADLAAIDITDENIGLARVEELSKQLLAFYERKAEKSVRQEYIDARAESLKKEFISVFRQRRKAAVDSLLDELLDEIPIGTAGEDLDAVFLKKQSDAATCVKTGDQCPEGYSGLLQVKELFRHFASSYEDYDAALTPEQFADQKIQNLISELTTQRFNELLEEHGNGSLPLEKRQELEAQAEAEATEAVKSEAVFDKQLALLGESKLDQEIQTQGTQHGFYEERDRRTRDNWRKAVSRAETGHLKKIRRNLIIVALHKLIENSNGFFFKAVAGRDIAFHEKNFERLQDYLLLDLTAIESQKTTALAFGIVRLHTLVHSLRVGKPERKHMDDILERTWGWAGSYGTWHAVKMVTAYPENFLIPEIRRDMTDHFMAVTEPLNETIPDELSEVFLSYHDRINEYVDMEIDATVPVGERLFLFAHNNDSIKYSVLNSRGMWSGWRNIEGLEPHLIRVSPSGSKIPDPTREHYRVFFRSKDENGQTIIYLFRKIAVRLSKEEKEELNTPHPMYATWNYVALRPEGDKLVNLAGVLEEGEGDSVEELSATWTEIEGSGNAVPSPQKTNHLYLAKTTDGLSLRFPYWRSDLHNTVEFQVDLAFNNDGTPIYKDRRHIQTGFITLARAVSDPSGQSIFWHQFGGHYSCASNDGSECGGREQHPEGPDDALYYEDWRTGEKKYIWWMYPGKKGFAAAKAPNGDAIISYFTPQSGNNNLRILRFRSVEGNIQVVSGASASVPREILYDRFGIMSGHIFVLGHRIFEDYQGDPYPKKEIVYTRLDFLDTEPLRLSFHSSLPGGGGEFSMNPYYYQQLTKPSDPIRFYLDEYLLHLPMYLAELLNRENRYAEAIKVLERVARDPLEPMCAQSDAVCFPGFNEVSLDAPAIEAWLVDPFNPYGLVNLDKRRYKVAWLLAYVQNIVDWADRLFTLDSPETVNLAREKYEYAAAILGLPYWAIRDEDSSQSSNMSIDDLYGQFESADDILADQLVLLGMIPEVVEMLGEVTIQDDIPDLSLLCLPANPKLAVLQWQIESNLKKISRNQNIAGLERDLQLYATPVDAGKLVRQAAAGQLDFEEAVPSTPPPIYRFSFLIEQAKYLVQIAQEFENSMLIAIQQAEEAEYTELRARQDLAIQHGTVILQQLRVQEAHDQVRLSEAQKERAEFSQGHFLDLLSDGLNSYEAMALHTLGFSMVLPASISVTAGVSPSTSVSYSPSGILQTLSSMASMQASYARRSEEWRYQANLAGFDIDAAQIGIDIATSHVEVTSQEEALARLSYDFAKDNVEFLTSRFGNAELYRWMRRQLRRLYRTQLNMAFAMAKTAQSALEFERQTSLDFIGFEYWDEPREGLLGAERLLSDISKLEQYRISSARRKKEIEATFSLAFYAPEELHRLRDTGVMEFRTLKSWFDRQFPGHYLRLIKNISVTTFALVPPNEGIHGTLSNPGISHAVVREPFDQLSTLYRLPESVALSSAGNATGLFELHMDDQMLLPFEGSGVDTSWRLEIPKGANRFDFSTIADILFTIRYTALEDRSYREKVLLEMGMDESGYVDVESRKGISIRNYYPDQWYHFFNPVGDVGLTNRKLEFRINSDGFPPNEHERKIKRVTVMLQLTGETSDEVQIAIPVLLEFKPESGVVTSDLLQIRSDQVAQSTDRMRGKSPYGMWAVMFQPQVASPVDSDWLKENIEDIFVVLDYKARAHYNR